MTSNSVILRSTIFFALVLPSHSAVALHIVLDPGHGGNDKGASRGGITESKITLSVAELVAQELKRDNQFKVTLTRTSDTFLTLEDRATFANKVGDLFLSIHVNSSSDPKARGHEIYFQNQLAPDQESLFLASRENALARADAKVARQVSFNIKSRPHLNSDVRAIVEDLERNHRLRLSAQLAESLYENWQGDHLMRRQPIRQAPFFVVSNVDRPAALIEIGYLSNEKEALRLTNPEYQKKIASGIYQAILQFKKVSQLKSHADKEVVDKSNTSSLK